MQIMNEIYLTFRSSNSLNEFIYSAKVYRRQSALVSIESQCVTLNSPCHTHSGDCPRNHS